MPDINCATVGGEDAIGVAWSGGWRITRRQALDLSRDADQSDQASDNPERARVYSIGPSVRGTAANGGVRGLFPDYSSHEACGARTNRIGARHAG